MTSRESDPPSADDFTVGLVYVKPLEMRALTTMLDERYRSGIARAHGDNNDYVLGRIGDHNVVVVGPPRGEQGTVATAQTVTSIRLTFQNVTVGLLVGIGGGIPNYPKNDVRLGDVVVGAPEGGPAVVQYDFGQRTADGRFEIAGTLAKPPRLLLNVVNKVEDKYDYLQDGDDDVLKVHLSRFLQYPKLRRDYDRPEVPDRLFQASFPHQPGTVCANHEIDMEVIRGARENKDHIVVHYSTILSGDTLMENPAERDLLSRKHNNALCLEMEAAGLTDVFPCLVIRGISDYADSHKNETWQKFAAAAAAAYAREILLNMAKQMPRLLPQQVLRTAETKPDSDAKTSGSKDHEHRNTGPRNSHPMSVGHAGQITTNNFGDNNGYMTNHFG
ncbi:hypothetical protein diail_4493 [Diaporthe ilicicola]|nr:hypothetical protein diail_4493 [Diaporthe ilicicola]